MGNLKNKGKFRKSFVFSIVLLALSLLAFQNCGKPFSSSPNKNAVVNQTDIEKAFKIPNLDPANSGYARTVGPDGKILVTYDLEALVFSPTLEIIMRWDLDPFEGGDNILSYSTFTSDGQYVIYQNASDQIYSRKIPQNIESSLGLAQERTTPWISSDNAWALLKTETGCREVRLNGQDPADILTTDLGCILLPDDRYFYITENGDVFLKKFGQSAVNISTGFNVYTDIKYEVMKNSNRLVLFAENSTTSMDTAIAIGFEDPSFVDFIEVQSHTSSMAYFYDGANEGFVKITADNNIVLSDFENVETILVENSGANTGSLYTYGNGSLIAWAQDSVDGAPENYDIVVGKSALPLSLANTTTINSSYNSPRGRILYRYGESQAILTLDASTYLWDWNNNQLQEIWGFGLINSGTLYFGQWIVGTYQMYNLATGAEVNLRDLGHDNCNDVYRRGYGNSNDPLYADFLVMNCESGASLLVIGPNGEIHELDVPNYSKNNLGDIRFIDDNTVSFTIFEDKQIRRPTHLVNLSTYKTGIAQTLFDLPNPWAASTFLRGDNTNVFYMGSSFSVKNDFLSPTPSPILSDMFNSNAGYIGFSTEDGLIRALSPSGQLLASIEAPEGGHFFGQNEFLQFFKREHLPESEILISNTYTHMKNNAQQLSEIRSFVYNVNDSSFSVIQPPGFERVQTSYLLGSPAGEKITIGFNNMDEQIAGFVASNGSYSPQWPTDVAAIAHEIYDDRKGLIYNPTNQRLYGVADLTANTGSVFSFDRDGLDFQIHSGSSIDISLGTQYLLTAENKIFLWGAEDGVTAGYIFNLSNQQVSKIYSFAESYVYTSLLGSVVRSVDGKLPMRRYNNETELWDYLVFDIVSGNESEPLATGIEPNDVLLFENQKKMIFKTYSEDTRLWNLLLVDYETGSRKTVFDYGAFIVGQHELSPDGKRLAFVAQFIEGEPAGAYLLNLE